MKENIALFGVASILLVFLGTLFFFQPQKEIPADFASCQRLGYPTAESYPRQCRAGEKTYVEDIGNELTKSDLIRLSSPRPGEMLSSPVRIEGEARGYWFFEASFPIEVRDANGEVLGIAIAQAQGDWMTEEFVSFEATIAFTASKFERGTLILKKDNPSGLPEHDDALLVPVTFPTRILGSCRPSGCSGQICSDADAITTCEYLPQDSCYN
ncbi:MAG: Gmad2 immunoglobulin-like domain-containing protein [Patescibacteria group bacterium]